MKFAIEELRKVYSETFEGAIVAQESQAEAFDAAILAVYRLGFKEGAERQRAVEPTEEMEAAAVPLLDSEHGFSVVHIYRIMSAVAPLVVQSE